MKLTDDSALDIILEREEPFELTYEKAIERLNITIRFPHKARILDIGSGDEGSDFVNYFGVKVPNSELFYIDRNLSSIRTLNRPNKFVADASALPFNDNTFDLGYAGSIISSGVNDNEYNDTSKIIQESYRVLKMGGLFIFTYDGKNYPQTIDCLECSGFKSLEKILRITAKGISLMDVYAAEK